MFDSLKSKYEKLDISSFPDLMKLMKFTFHGESTEKLIAAIKQFQSDTPEQCLFDDTTAYYNTIVFLIPIKICFLFHSTDRKFVVMKYGELLIEINHDLFYLKLRQTIDETYKHSHNFDIDSSYVRLLNICLESNIAFQQFYRRTAQTMIEFQYPEHIQNYLDQLLCDIRIRLSSSEQFYSMYSDDLYFYVQLVDHSCPTSDSNSNNENTNSTVNCILLKLKTENFLRFVILTTHFKTYRHLLIERNLQQ